MYGSLIGSFLYVTNNRLDILQVVSLLSRLIQSPSKFHYGAARRILRYTLKEQALMAFVTLKLVTLCCMVFLNVIGQVQLMIIGALQVVFSMESGGISWCSKKHHLPYPQKLNEYMALILAVCQATWLRKILHEGGSNKCLL